MSDSPGVQTNSPDTSAPYVWVSSLGVAALPALTAIFFKHGRFVLRCTAMSRGAGTIASLLRLLRIIYGRCLTVEFTPDAERVDVPDSRRLFIQGHFPNEFVELFFAQHRQLLARIKYPDSKVNRERVLANLRKSIGQTTFQLMAFAEFAFLWHRSHGTPVERLVVVSPDAVIANTVAGSWHDRDIEFRSTWSPQQSLMLQFVSSLAPVIVNAFRVRRKRDTHPVSVGVEHAWGLDRLAGLDELFWWWDSGIPARRIILFFDRSDFDAKKDTVAAAQALGIRCAVTHPRAVGDSPQLLWRPSSPGLKISLVRLWQLFAAFRFGLFRSGPFRSRAGAWAACRILGMLRNSEEQEDFLTDFNLKAVFHFQDGGPDYLSLACDAVGSARIGYHWSHLPWPEASVIRLHQIYFAWGQYQLDMLEANHSVVDQVLVSGCIVHGASPGIPPNRDVMEQRAAAERAGASRILAIFDTSTACGNFYEFFLRRALEDPRWGLLIKAKGPFTLPSALDQPVQLQNVYREALATGRVRELEYRLSPADAASGADLAVGIEIGSASVVAALAGHRSICLDYANVHQTPLGRWATLHHAAPDRSVFNNPEDLWRRLNEYFDDPDSDPELGLAGEPALREIDPFRDGEAGSRIGDFVRMYLENIDHGRSSVQAVSEASRHYAEKWWPVVSQAKTPAGSNGQAIADGPLGIR